MPAIKVLELPRETEVVVVGAIDKKYKCSRVQFAAWRQENLGATPLDAEVFIKASFAGLKGCDVYVHVVSLPVSVVEAPRLAVLVCDKGSPVSPNWWEGVEE